MTDSDGSTDTSTITITVVDDVPTAVDDSTSQSSEDSDVIHNVLDNDTQGADGATVTAASVNTGTGSVAFLADGQVTYTPGTNEEGTVLIDYTITDGDGDTDTATLTITLSDDSVPLVNVASVAVDETNGLT